MSVFRNKFGKKVIPSLLAGCVALGSVLTFPAKAMAGGGAAAAIAAAIIITSNNARSRVQTTQRQQPPSNLSPYEQRLVRDKASQALLAAATEAQTDDEKLAVLEAHYNALPAKMTDRGPYNEISLQGGRIKLLYFKEAQTLVKGGESLLNVPIFEGLSLDGKGIEQKTTLKGTPGTFILFADLARNTGWFSGAFYKQEIHVLYPHQKSDIFVVTADGQKAGNAETSFWCMDGGYNAYVLKALDAAAAKDPTLVGVLAAYYQVLHDNVSQANQPKHPTTILYVQGDDATPKVK